MTTIHKYPLQLTQDQKIWMPECAHILCAQEQYGVVTIWAQVEDRLPLSERTILIYGTGGALAPIPQRYIGTAQLGGYVWHVFEPMPL